MRKAMGISFVELPICNKVAWPLSAIIRAKII